MSELYKRLSVVALVVAAALGIKAVYVTGDLTDQVRENMALTETNQTLESNIDWYHEALQEQREAFIKAKGGNTMILWDDLDYDGLYVHLQYSDNGILKVPTTVCEQSDNALYVFDYVTAWGFATPKETSLERIEQELSNQGF